MNKKYLSLILFILIFFVSGCSVLKTDYVKEGNRYFAETDFQKALDYYQKAIDENPNNDDAYAMYCRTKNALHTIDNSVDLKSAEVYCDKALELNDKNINALYAKAGIYKNFENNVESETLCEKLLKINPKHSATYAGLGSLYLMEYKNYDKAIEYFKKAIKYNNFMVKDSKVVVYADIAIAYKNKYDAKNANKYFKKAANYKLKYDLFEFYAARAFAKYEIKDIDGSIEDTKKAIELDKNHSALLYDLLIYSYGVQKNENMALEVANNSIKKVKNPEVIYYDRVRIKNTIRQKECIDKKILNCTLTQSTKDDLKIAKKLFKQNEYGNNQALVDFKDKALKTNENVLFYWNNINVKWHYQMYDDSISDHTQILKIEPNNEYIYVGLGDTYSKLKQYDKAISNYTKAISLSNHDFDYLYTLRAIAYAKNNKNDEALKDFTKALEYNPDYKYAKLGKIKLKFNNLLNKNKFYISIFQ